MPNASFQPLIGSGFDALAAQSQFYQGFNNQVESQNLARQQAAQDRANAYAMAVSEAQRADAARQAQLDQQAALAAIEHGTRAQNLARQDYQFGVQTDLTKNNQRINEEHYKWVNDQQKDQEKSFIDSLDESAKFNAPTLKSTIQKMREARDAFANAEKSMLLEAGNQKSKLDPVLASKLVVSKNGELEPTKLWTLSPVESTAVQKANDALAKARADYSSAAELRLQHEQNLNSILNRIPKQLQVNPDTGEILNPYNKLRFGTETANPLLSPESAPVPDTTTQLANPFGASMNVNPTDATAGTGTGGYMWGGNPVAQPAQSNSAMAPIKVGKYFVSPQ